MMFLFPKQIVGMLANWACRQAPIFPENLEIVLGKAENIIREDPGVNERALGCDMFGCTYDQLDELLEQICKIPELRDWNLSKVEKEKGVLVDDESRPPFNFSSRYDQPKAEYDFVDLSALHRNILNDLVKEFGEDEDRYPKNGKAAPCTTKGVETSNIKFISTEYINELIQKVPETNGISDGYHTFGELYQHRIALWIALCKKYDSHSGYYRPWRTLRHSDGELAFGGTWFVLGLHESRDTEPVFQLTYHLPISEWENCDWATTLEKAPEYDGHTSADVLERLRQL